MAAGRVVQPREGGLERYCAATSVHFKSMKLIAVLLAVLLAACTEAPASVAKPATQERHAAAEAALSRTPVARTFDIGEHQLVLVRAKRSQSAKVEFKAQHPCPANGATKGPCKGYVIDHVKALACGGIDAPSNMQWQTIAEGKAKDKWERKECGR